MIGLILAAGDGKRLFGNEAKDKCKPLVEINGKRLLSYSLDNCLRLNIKKAVIVVGKHKERIREYYGNIYKGIELVYVDQKEPLGISNAVLSAKDHIDDDFILQLSDEIYVDFKTYPEYINESIDFCIGYVKEKNREKIKRNYSIELSANGEIMRCIEKPKNPINDLKGTGFCVFKRQMLNLLYSSYKKEIGIHGDLCDFINLLIQNGKTGKAIEVAKEEVNINTLDDFRYAENI